MKKLSIVVIFIVVVALIWIGAAWYTGKLIEQQIHSKIDEFNQYIHNDLPDAGITITNEGYQRHLFSSKAWIVIHNQPHSPYQGKIPQPGEKLVFQETFYHGPFPFNQLKKFNLIPSMVSIESQLAQTANLNPLFVAANGLPPMIAYSHIRYGGAAENTIIFNPLVFQQNKKNIQFAGGRIDINMDANNTRINIRAQSPGLTLSSQSTSGVPAKIIIKDIHLINDAQRSPLNFNLALKEFSIKQLMVLEGHDTLTQLDEIRLSSHVEKNNAEINGILDYSINAMKVKNNNFGQGQLSFIFEGIDSQAIKLFFNQYHQLRVKDPHLPPSFSLLLKNNLPALLAHQPRFKIFPLIWKTPQGNSQLILTLKLADAQNAELNLLNMIQSLDAKLSVSLPMLTNVITQATELEGYNPVEARQIAQQQVKGATSIGKMLNVITQEQQNIHSHIRYLDHQIDINGVKMPLEEFVKRYLSVEGVAN